MSIIVSADIEAVFGVGNVAEWANLEGSGTSTVDTRIAASIAYAEGFLGDRLRKSKYVVPVSANGGSLTVIKNILAIYAGEWLYLSRGISNEAVIETLDNLKRWADDTVSAYLNGTMEMDAQLSDTDMPDCPVVVNGEG